MNFEKHIESYAHYKQTLGIICLSLCFSTTTPTLVNADTWQSADRRTNVERRSVDRQGNDRRVSAKIGVSVEVVPSCAVQYDSNRNMALIKQVNVQCTKTNNYNILSNKNLQTSSNLSGATLSQEEVTINNQAMTVLSLNF